MQIKFKMKKKKGKNKKINENIDSSEDLEKEVSLNGKENDQKKSNEKEDKEWLKLLENDLDNFSLWSSEDNSENQANIIIEEDETKGKIEKIPDNTIKKETNLSKNILLENNAINENVEKK